jgi:SAM-dependent methyltransferase
MKRDRRTGGGDAAENGPAGGGAGYWFERGRALGARADYFAALEAFRRAVKADPAHPGGLAGLAEILRGLRGKKASPEIEGALLAAFASPAANYDDFRDAAAHQLALKHGLPADAASLSAAAVAGDPLFAAYLEKCLNADADLERALRGLRRRLLLAGPEAISGAALEGAALLASQCFFNEYVFFAADDEKAALALLGKDIETALTNGESLEAMRPALVLHCLYAPLAALAGAGRLLDFDAAALGPDLDRLVRLTLRDHRTELALKKHIETLAPVADATSRKVKAQYEANPYPRWRFAPAEGPAGRGIDREGPLDILIAGAGTGRQVARVRRDCPDARIVAVDLSRASIAYAMRALAELGVAGVRFLEADILDLGRLGETFDMVQSVGVLHHMQDPLAGWRVLSGLTRPGGTMKIGLYSERGRAAVRACRRVIAKEGVAATPDGIARFRRRLMEGAVAGLAKADAAAILGTPDFYSASMCRDLLFHVEEHHATPASLRRDLDALGLAFIGFEMFEQAGINAAYRRAYPGDADLVDLGNWEAFEKQEGPLTDLYLLWCRKPAC